MYTVREGKGRNYRKREGREGGERGREGREGGKEGEGRVREGGRKGGSIQCSGNINYSFYIVNGKTHFRQLIHIFSFTSSLT